MSELENDYEVEQEQDEYVEEVEAEEVEEVESEDEPSELAPDSDAEHEEKPQDENRVNQEKINQVINEKHRKMREAEERAAEYERRLQQYESQQQQQAPDILPLPDAFDDDYDEKIKARDESIQRRVQWEAEQKSRQQSQQYEAQKAQQSQMEKLQAQAKTYSERAKSYGISNEELQQAANAVAQAGISDDLAVAILHDEDGPLFTKYLASNPVEAYEIASMGAAQAALHLERVIRPKAAALKPKKTSAPKPTTKHKTVVGDKDLGKYRNLGNAKFE